MLINYSKVKDLIFSFNDDGDTLDQRLWSDLLVSRILLSLENLKEQEEQEKKGLKTDVC
jgi:hypothetical protein